MQLKRDQVNQILNAAPVGSDKKKVLDGLIERGYDIEGVDSGAIRKSLTFQTQTQPKQSVLNETFGDIKQVGKDLLASRDKRALNLNQISDNVKTGKTNPIEGGFQQAGQVAGAGADAIGAFFKGAANIFINDEHEKLVTKKIQEGGANAMKDPLVGGVVKNIIDKYNSLDENGKRNVDAVGGIASLLSEFVGGRVATKGAEATIRGASNLQEGFSAGLDNAGGAVSKYSSKIADAVSEKITRLDPKVKNVLETANIEKFDNYVKVGEEAVKNPRALTPLEVAGDHVKTRILPAVKEDLSNIGKQKAKTISSVGKTQVIDGTKDATDFIKESVKNAKLTSEETKLVKNIIKELEIGKSPTISTMDKTVDLLQNTLFERTKGLAIPTTSRVQGIVNQAIGKLNNKLKEAAKKALGSDEYTLLNDAYSKKITLFNKVNKVLGEEGVRGGSVMKRFFSPQDSGIKKLFAEIKDTYGIDLAEDATLAKFIMDSLGDTRSASILEQIPLSKGGAVTKVLQYAEKKLTRPIKKARKVIESRPQSKLE